MKVNMVNGCFQFIPEYKEEQAALLELYKGLNGDPTAYRKPGHLPYRCPVQEPDRSQD